MVMTPNDLERQFTLLTAAARHDQLRVREALAPPQPEPAMTREPPMTRPPAMTPARRR